MNELITKSLIEYRAKLLMANSKAKLVFNIVLFEGKDFNECVAKAFEVPWVKEELEIIGHLHNVGPDEAKKIWAEEQFDSIEKYRASIAVENQKIEAARLKTAEEMKGFDWTSTNS